MKRTMTTRRFAGVVAAYWKHQVGGGAVRCHRTKTAVACEFRHPAGAVFHLVIPRRLLSLESGHDAENADLTTSWLIDLAEANCLPCPPYHAVQTRGTPA